MEIIKCNLILITKPTRKHSYFFLFLLGAFLRVLCPELLIKYTKYEVKDELKPKMTQKYFELIRNITSDLLFGIFYLIHKMRNKYESSKTNQQSYNTNNKKIYFIFNDESSRIPTTYKIIFIISLVDIICQLLIPIYFLLKDKLFPDKEEKFYNKEYQLYSLLFFDIFARYLFSRWILKTYFYIHHYLSFILNIIGLVCISVAYIKTIDYSLNYMMFVIIASIKIILYSFEDIMNKVAFSTIYILPNTLVFFKGLIQLLYLGIISVLFFCFNLRDKEYDYKFEVKFFISFILFNILRTYYLVKVIDKFSAQHMTILKVFETIILYIIYHFILIQKSNGIIYNILEIIGFLFLTIASLIHNELIIINHPKLKAKTEYYLNKDADKEQCNSFYSDTLFSDSKDDNSLTNLYSDLTGSDIS